MYPSFVRDATESAYNYYNYAKRNKTSRTESGVSEIQQISRETYILFLSKKLNRPDSACISIKSHLIEPEWYSEKDESYINPNLFEILQADMVKVTITIKIKRPLLDIFNLIEKNQISIISDLKFLIRNVMKWYQEFGDCISLPSPPDIHEEEIYFRGNYSQKAKETKEQKVAVKTALSKRISYIWGAPGTGKTQYVLADCLLTYIKRGDKVVVLAPTHNAIEQTLDAVIKTMESQGEDINCIYRLGIPTASFAAKYPTLCEKIDCNTTIENLTKEIEQLNSLIFDQEKNQQITRCYSAFSEIYKKIQTYELLISEKIKLQTELTEELSEAKSQLKENENIYKNIKNNIKTICLRENSIAFKLKSIFTQKEAIELITKKQTLSDELKGIESTIKLLGKSSTSLNTRLREISTEKEKLLRQQHKDVENAKSIIIQTFGGYYFNDIADAYKYFTEECLTAQKIPIDTQLYQKLTNKESELAELSSNNAKIMEEKQVFAFTVDYFFAHYKILTEQDIGSISHVFLDEAAYCPLIKSGILYSLGAPVTLLGDHMQLEPICEAGKQATDNIASKIFLWEQSAVYFPQIFDVDASLEALFKRYTMIKNSEDITQVKYYSEENMTTATLPQTHRFGCNLASILDFFVYKNGFTGNKNANTRSYYLHAKRHPNEIGARTSTGEVDAITNLILRENFTNCVVMTPYKNQRDLLHKKLGKIIGTDNILTVHASQGREWDTVILSVVDSTDRDSFFTNSEITPGLHTINTAISRVKKNLIIVCDTDYWKKKGSTQLIGAIISDSRAQNAELPFLENINISWSENMLSFYRAGIEAGRLKTALDEQEQIYSRFGIININKNKAPYAHIVIDGDTKYGPYKTSLSSCTCYDYQKNLKQKSPCKHIMALALKLKLINPDSTVNSTISIPSIDVTFIS